MATQKQIEANQRNAQKSTGPITDAGKLIVSPERNHPWSDRGTRAAGGAGGVRSFRYRAQLRMAAGEPSGAASPRTFDPLRLAIEADHRHWNQRTLRYVPDRAGAQWQALDCLDPVLPLSPGRLERHALSLYAALDVKTGKAQGKTAEPYTSAEFVSFLEQVISGCQPHQEIHMILDNLSAHKTHPRPRLPNSRPLRTFTAQQEDWLSKILACAAMESPDSGSVGSVSL
jgi:hypothetical protein